MITAKEPRYATDLVNKAYVDKLVGTVENKIPETNNFKNFGSQPTPPYHVNDTWSDGGNFYICITERLIGDFNINDWQLIIQDAETVLEDFITDIYDPDKLILQEQIDGKIETHYQSTDPSASWDTTLLREKHVGDYWYNTTTKEQKRWNKIPGTPPTYSWGDVDIPTVIYDMIDSKKTIFTETPSSYKENDMWIIETTVNPLNIPTGASIGEYVFATQDSDTFDKTHWIKRDVYVPIGELETNYYNKVQIGDIVTTIESDIDTAITQSETDILLEVDATYSTKTEVNEALIPINSDINDIDNAIATINTTVSNHTTDISNLGISQGEISAQVSTVETLAKSKTKTFLVQPTTPYYVGDRYKVNGIEKVCITQRLTGNYTASDWEEFDYPTQSDIDTAKAQAISTAQTYADTKKTEAIAAAELVTIAKANLAEANAKAYADGVVTDEENARILDATNKLNEAKSYAETKASEAESAASALATTAQETADQATLDIIGINTSISEIQINNDSISQSVTDIITNISEIGTATDNKIAQVESAIQTINSTMQEQTSTAIITWFNSTGIQGTLDDIQEGLTSNTSTLSNIQAYIRESIETNVSSPYYGLPYIELGKTGNETRLIIRNNRISFMTGSNESAYISANQLYITDSTILNKLQVGYWEIKPDELGNLNKRWVGGE